MATLTKKPLSWFKLDPKQPRKHFDETELRQLGESLGVKQLQPVLALPNGTLIAGERRFRAASLVRLPELDVLITEDPLTESEIRVIQLTENIQRSELTGPEQTDACSELLKLNPSWTNQDLAQHLKVDPSTVTRLLAPLKCTPSVLEAYRTGRITISESYEFYKLTESAQATLLELRLNGKIKGREAIAAQGQKLRNGDQPRVRLSKTKLVLPSATISVASEEMSLEDLIETLKLALESAKKAHKEQLDIRTFEHVLKDKKGKSSE